MLLCRENSDSFTLEKIEEKSFKLRRTPVISHLLMALQLPVDVIVDAKNARIFVEVKFNYWRTACALHLYHL